MQHCYLENAILNEKVGYPCCSIQLTLWMIPNFLPQAEVDELIDVLEEVNDTNVKKVSLVSTKRISIIINQLVSLNDLICDGQVFFPGVLT